jgi:hypothetical protein
VQQMARRVIEFKNGQGCGVTLRLRPGLTHNRSPNMAITFDMKYPQYASYH